jgi:hypothetical protein
MIQLPRVPRLLPKQGIAFFWRMSYRNFRGKDDGMKYVLFAATLLLLSTAAWADYSQNLPPYAVPTPPPPSYHSSAFNIMAPIKASSPFSLGLGVGTMYGQAGTNLEYHASQYLSGTVGAGLNGKSNWFAGTRFYMRPEGSGTRPRITVGLGTNGDNSLTGSARGTKVIFAVGGTWGNGNNDYRGFDVDISSIGSISVGYHF